MKKCFSKTKTANVSAVCNDSRVINPIKMITELEIHQYPNVNKVDYMSFVISLKEPIMEAFSYLNGLEVQLGLNVWDNKFKWRIKSNGVDIERTDDIIKRVGDVIKQAYNELNVKFGNYSNWVFVLSSEYGFCKTYAMSQYKETEIQTMWINSTNEHKFN